MQQPKWIHLNGQLVPTEQALLHVSDLALLRGYGVFDFMPVRQGVPLFLDRYLDRFQRSANWLNLPWITDRDTLKTWIFATIEANRLPIAGIKLVLTGGYSPDGFLPASPNFIIINQLYPIGSEEQFRNGVKLHLFQHVRELPEAKTLNYMIPIRAWSEVKQSGAFDLLYHDGTFISESSRSNFFVVTQDGVLVTPDKGVLKGTTRGSVVEVAASLGIPVEEREVTLAELRQAAEAFITSTTKGVLGVVGTQGGAIGTGKVGVITQHLHDGFLAFSQAYFDEHAALAFSSSPA